MITMKDVAKLAGVSHGTVSNVVNGVKNVSVDKIKKVEEAMAILGYKPNSAARNLKMEFTNQIDLVVPNMISAEFPELYEAMRKCAEKSAYTLNLKVTNGIADEECRILNESIMNNVDGVILVTCQPSNRSFFEDIIKKGLRIMFCIADLVGSNCNFVGFDISDTMEELIGYYRDQGKRIALVTEDTESSYHDQLINTYCKGIFLEHPKEHGKYMEIIQVSAEYAMKGAAKVFALSPPPDVVITSNSTVAREIHRFQYLLEGKENGDLQIVIFNPGKVTPFFEDEIIPLPFKSLGRLAFDALVDQIEGRGGHGNYRTLVRPSESIRGMDGTRACPRQKKPLRILLNESPSSDAVKALLPNFIRKTGIQAEIVTKKINHMHDAVFADREDKQYDIYSVDVPWMEELVQNQMVLNLDGFAKEHGACFAPYSEDVLDAFSRVGGSLYAIPYAFSVQLLFYRKDLFDKIKNQRLYYEWYKEDLKVPSTWEDFNKIARLFTRKYNPDSETKYGITLGASAYSGAILEYIPRLWALGGDIFEKNGVLTHEKLAQKALENYMEGFQYANPKAVDWWWNEQVNEFERGQAAMMTMFTEHANVLAEKKHSRIAGKYETAILPGESARGGWSLVVRESTSCKEEAFEFLKWINDRELLEEHAVLGRVYPVMDEEAKEVLNTIYPWFDTALQGFCHARSRHVPKKYSEGNAISETGVENMIGKWVHKAVVGQIDAASAISGLRQDILGKI